MYVYAWSIAHKPAIGLTSRGSERERETYLLIVMPAHTYIYSYVQPWTQGGKLSCGTGGHLPSTVK